MDISDKKVKIVNRSNLSRKHHYVPACYLRGFTDQNKELHVCRKENCSFRWFKSKPEGILFEKDRHVFVNSKGDKDYEAMEKMFCELEKEIAPYLRIKKGDSPSQVRASLDGLIHFMFHLIRRGDVFWKSFEKTLAYKEQISMDDTNLVKYARYSSSLDNVSLTKYIVRNFQKIFIPAIDGLWFITGDCPVVMGVPGEGMNYLVGLKSDRVEIYFPINKNVCLVLMKTQDTLIKDLFSSKSKIKNVIKEINRSVLRMCKHTIVSPEILPEKLIKNHFLRA